MDCHVCGGKIKCTRSLSEGNFVYREYTCGYCGERYAGRDEIHPLYSDAGQIFSKKFNSIMWGRYGKLPAELRRPKMVRK